MRKPARQTGDLATNSGGFVALRTGSAVWMGGGRHGLGFVSTDSGALRSHPFTLGSRVNGGACTNPEELIAAAHASSFTICLAQMLAEANLAVDHINTTALLTLDSSHRGFAISHLHLVLTASATFADEKTFLSLVARAKEDCAVSRLLNAQISVDAKLIDRTALQEWNRRIQ